MSITLVSGIDDLVKCAEETLTTFGCVCVSRFDQKTALKTATRIAKRHPNRVFIAEDDEIVPYQLANLNATQVDFMEHNANLVANKVLFNLQSIKTLFFFVAHKLDSSADHSRKRCQHIGRFGRGRLHAQTQHSGETTDEVLDGKRSQSETAT